MPSSTGRGRQYGYCSDCHWKRIRRYRQTEKGKEVQRGVRNRYRRKLRQQVLDAYGPFCSCCGETEPVFLTIDHIDDDGGGRDRFKAGQQFAGVSFYAKIRREGFPKDRYRVMCFNCNTGRYINGGICPHEEMVQKMRSTGTWP